MSKKKIQRYTLGRREYLEMDDEGLWCRHRDHLEFVDRAISETLDLAAKAIRDECTVCGGLGATLVGARYVTDEMATDAGQPERAGELLDQEVLECEYCGRPAAVVLALKETTDD